MTTIKDVARVAGVSFKTVSRVVNGDPTVGADYRQRIEAAIRQLNYRPTLAARQLASNRSFIVTLIIPGLVVSYVSRSMMAMVTECRAVGYHLVTEIFNPTPNEHGNHTFPEFSVRSDAVIVIPPFSDHQPLLQHLATLGVPVVRVASIDKTDPRVIRVDDTDISIQLIEHLIDMGHRRIAMIGPPLPEKASETRVVGYRRAMTRAGLPLDPDLFLRGDFSFASGVHCTTRLLALPERPTAIFAVSDEMALGAMARARQLGYAVPDNLAIAGFDDSAESRMVWPQLTTVYQPLIDIAKAAVHVATGRGSPPQSLNHVLNVRGSTSGSRELQLDPYEI